MGSWVLLTYRMPREPSAARVALWRRLRRLGAVRTHDAGWALPATAWTREQFQWLASEVRAAGGASRMWTAEPFPPGSDGDLERLLRRRSDEAYRRLLKRLRRGGADAGALAREYRRLREQDYFHSEFGEQARAALLGAAPAAPAARGPRARGRRGARAERAR